MNYQNTTLIIVGAICLGLSSNSYPASFDCAKASIQIEKTICSEKQLSKLDDLLSQVYKKAALSAANKSALKMEQRSWLKNIRNICQTAGCLENAYKERITALSSTEQTPQQNTQESTLNAPKSNFTKTAQVDQSSEARKQSREKFISQYQQYDILGIHIGDPIGKLEPILKKHFGQNVSCSLKPGKSSDGNKYGSCNTLKYGDENITVDLIGDNQMAHTIIYDQRGPFAENETACYEKAISGANKLVEKNGTPFLTFTINQSVYEDDTMHSKFITLGWGDVGNIRGGGYVGIPVSYYKDSDENRICGDGYIANFSCNDDGSINVHTEILASSFAKQHTNKPKPKGINL
jgi:uncharacterized protein